MALAERVVERSRNHDRKSTFRGAFRYQDREKASRALVKELGEPSAAFFPPKDNGIATLEDIQNRIRQQNERCVELLQYADWDSSRLPDSWKKYLVRHWEDITSLLSPAESAMPA